MPLDMAARTLQVRMDASSNQVGCFGLSWSLDPAYCFLQEEGKDDAATIPCAAVDWPSDRHRQSSASPGPAPFDGLSSR